MEKENIWEMEVKTDYQGKIQKYQVGMQGM